jgi:hypothetical protein
VSGPAIICAINAPRNRKVSTPPIADNEELVCLDNSLSTGPTPAINIPNTKKMQKLSAMMTFGEVVFMTFSFSK